MCGGGFVGFPKEWPEVWNSGVCKKWAVSQAGQFRALRVFTWTSQLISTLEPSGKVFLFWATAAFVYTGHGLTALLMLLISHKQLNWIHLTHTVILKGRLYFYLDFTYKFMWNTMGDVGSIMAVPHVVYWLVGSYCPKHAPYAIQFHSQCNPKKWMLLTFCVVWMVMKMMMMLTTFAKVKIPYISTWTQNEDILYPHSLYTCMIMHACANITHTQTHTHTHTPLPHHYYIFLPRLSSRVHEYGEIANKVIPIYT